MNILEGATLYLDNKPLKGDPAKHFGALFEASRQGKAVGFTQPQPPRLLVTLFTDLVGEAALSSKLLELITAEVTPTFILDGPSGLSSYYLIEEALEEGEWQRLGEAVAKQFGGTPAVQEEILPLPGFGGTTLLHASETPLTRDALVAVFPTEEVVAAQPAHAQPREDQKDPQALREAIKATDLPALVAHHYPESGAKPGVESAVKAVWRGDENPSFSLFRSEDGGTWLYRDHATGEKGNAFGFLVDILQLPRAEAAEALKDGGFIASRTPAPIRQMSEKVKSAVKKPAARSRIVKSYAYTDEQYNLLFEVVRFTPKRFAQRRKDPETGAWVWGLKAGGYIKGANGDWVIPKNGEPAEREFPACRHVLYHLPKLVATASRGETVYLVEGEKDVETLESFDLIATCNPMGSLKWDESYTEALKGRRVVNLPDNDKAGQQHAAMVKDALKEATNFCSHLLPGLPTTGDVTDWFDAGNTLERFLELTAPERTVSEASYEEMQTALWQAVNAGTVQPFVHPLSNMELTPSNAHFCLKDALETPQKKDSQRVIGSAYSSLQSAPTPQVQERTHA
jgi:hypothetical protein